MPLAAGIILSFTAALLARVAGLDRFMAWFSVPRVSRPSHRGELANLAALLRQ
jgi:hypothetical protein